MQQQETIEVYIQALAIYNTTLKFNPNDLKTLKRKGYEERKVVPATARATAPR
ncbi:MAG: hypothetical protein KME55_34940 [Nostoc indistinguendum CM1-VF10]|jgi:hypothetical protein|nr:hypothetical protein [Nostoc indistinguendum CM1-VF10]